MWPSLLHSLWIGLFAASVVVLVFQTGTRLSHHLRHVILLVALVLITLGPAVAALLQQAIAGRPGRSAVPNSEVKVVAPARKLGQGAPTADRTAVVPSQATRPSEARYIARVSVRLSSLADAERKVRLLALAAWSLGVGLSGGFLAMGATAVHRRRREADPASPRIQERARALARRLRLKDRLRLVLQEADVSAWIIDDKALSDLLTSAQRESTANVLQAPKVAAYENARATIVNRGKLNYVSGVDCQRSDASGAVGFSPIVKNVDVGCELDVTGSLLPRGMRLSVDLHDSSLLVLRTLLRKERSGDQQINATYQVPTMIERRCCTSCDLSDGSSLLISLGLDERRGTLSGTARAASDLLEAIGLPHLEARNVTSERLVVIRPRRIVLEAEEQPIKAGSNVTSKRRMR